LPASVMPLMRLPMTCRGSHAYCMPPILTMAPPCC
jgi:hypothetical protein